MKAIRKILVPIDFSKNSINVLQEAVNIANYSRAQLVLLHVYKRPIFHDGKSRLLRKSVFYQLDRTLLKWREKRIDNRFEQLLKDISNIYDTHFTIIKSIGLLTTKIKEIVKRYHIDLVVMGIQQTDKKHHIWSHKASRLTDKIKAPILTIPYSYQFNKSIKIAVAYDLKEIRRLDDLNIVKIISNYFDSEIHIFTVIKGPHLSKSESHNLEILKAYFEEYSPEIHLVRHPDVVEGIQHYIKSYKISLLTVLHHSRNAFKGLFHRSISRSLTNKSEVPVLSIEE